MVSQAAVLREAVFFGKDTVPPHLFPVCRYR
jgi:hypothetical protein